ncbi:MAG: META domain-containing protein [Paramuribaculum sp.]|nr:META domain-containing protein [Paramuribaculum sp.]
MKKILTSLSGLITLTLLIISCSDGGKKIQGHWNIVEYDCIFTSSHQLTTITTYPRLLFSFYPDGTFNCNTDCNALSGNYIADDTNLSFSDISSTEIACENELIERSLKVLIPEVETYELSGDSIINMYDKKGSLLIRLSRR